MIAGGGCGNGAGLQGHFNPQIQVGQGLTQTAPFPGPQFVQLLLRQAEKLFVTNHSVSKCGRERLQGKIHIGTFPELDMDGF